MTYTYTPHGVCSRNIIIDIDENTVIPINYDNPIKPYGMFYLSKCFETGREILFNEKGHVILYGNYVIHISSIQNFYIYKIFGERYSQINRFFNREFGMLRFHDDRYSGPGDSQNRGGEGYYLVYNAIKLENTFSEVHIDFDRELLKNGCVVVRESNKYGLYDLNKRTLIIDCKYDRIVVEKRSDYNSERHYVMKDFAKNHIGIFDRKGKIIVPCNYDKIRFEEMLECYRCESNGVIDYISEDGIAYIY